jgi:hypothetical protein
MYSKKLFATVCRKLSRDLHYHCALLSISLITIMKYLFRSFLFSSLTILATGIFAQDAPLAIKKITTADPKMPVYIASFPMRLKETESKSMMIAPRIATDRVTGELGQISGVQIFTKGLGKCFFRDTLELVFANKKRIKLAATSPQFCDNQLSAWYDMNKDHFAILFASPLVQVRFKNSKTGESFRQDVTEQYQQEYFMELKTLHDEMAAAKK